MSDIDDVIEVLELVLSKSSGHGKWFCSGNELYLAGPDGLGEFGQVKFWLKLQGATSADAHSIAATHNNTPVLIAEIRRLRQLLTDYQE